MENIRATLLNRQQKGRPTEASAPAYYRDFQKFLNDIGL